MKAHTKTDSGLACKANKESKAQCAFHRPAEPYIIVTNQTLLESHGEHSALWLFATCRDHTVLFSQTLFQFHFEIQTITTALALTNTGTFRLATASTQAELGALPSTRTLCPDHEISFQALDESCVVPQTQPIAFSHAKSRINIAPKAHSKLMAHSPCNYHTGLQSYLSYPSGGPRTEITSEALTRTETEFQITHHIHAELQLQLHLHRQLTDETHGLSHFCTLKADAKTHADSHPTTNQNDNQRHDQAGALSPVEPKAQPSETKIQPTESFPTEHEARFQFTIRTDSKSHCKAAIEGASQIQSEPTPQSHGASQSQTTRRNQSTPHQSQFAKPHDQSDAEVLVVSFIQWTVQTRSKVSEHSTCQSGFGLQTQPHLMAFTIVICPALAHVHVHALAQTLSVTRLGPPAVRIHSRTGPLQVQAVIPTDAKLQVQPTSLAILSRTPSKPWTKISSDAERFGTDLESSEAPLGTTTVLADFGIFFLTDMPYLCSHTSGKLSSRIQHFERCLNTGKPWARKKV